MFSREGSLEAERNTYPPNAVFRGKRYDNNILNVQILSSRNIGVIAQAPIFPEIRGHKNPSKQQTKILRELFSKSLRVTVFIRECPRTVL